MCCIHKHFLPYSKELRKEHSSDVGNDNMVDTHQVLKFKTIKQITVQEKCFMIDTSPKVAVQLQVKVSKTET